MNGFDWVVNDSTMVCLFLIVSHALLEGFKVVPVPRYRSARSRPPSAPACTVVTLVGGLRVFLRSHSGADSAEPE